MMQNDWSPAIVRSIIRDDLDEALYGNSGLSKTDVIMPIANKFDNAFALLKSIKGCIFDYYEQQWRIENS